MPAPAELYSIVIVGSMNPAIHHPAWYEAANILSGDETDHAALTACTPVLSQFQVAGLTITCTQERWELQSAEPGNLEKMLGIAGQTFDTLMHTPLRAFGLNFHFLRQTGLKDVGKRLAELINGLPIGRKPTASDSVLIVTTTTLPDRVLQETVAGAPEVPGLVSVAYNVNHPIKAEGILFKLTPLLRHAFAADYPECLARANQLANAVADTQKE